MFRLMRAVHEVEGRRLSGLSEALLLEGLRKGDEACFEEIFLRHRDKVHAVLFRLLGEREEAEDLTQEVFLRLYRRPVAGGQEANLAGWLYRVAINAGYNALRGRKRGKSREERADWTGPGAAFGDPPEQVLIAEERAKVRAILMEMGERARSCLLLRHAGLSYAEIGATLGIARASVGTVLARAEREFRDRYEAARKDELG